MPTSIVHPSDKTHTNGQEGLGDKRTRRLRGGGIWTVGGRALGISALVGNHVLLERSLTAVHYGDFVIAITLATLSSLFAMFGANTLLCRYLSESMALRRPEQATCSVRVVVVAALLWIPIASGASFFASGWIAGTLLDRLRAAALLAGVTGGTLANSIFFVAISCQMMTSTLTLFSAVITMTMSLLVVTLLALTALWATWPKAETPPSCVASPRLVGSTPANGPSAAHILSGDHTAQHNATPLSLPRLVADAWPIAALQLVSYVAAQGDIWMVAAWRSDQDLATYAIVRRIALLVALPLTLTNSVIASTVSELFARRLGSPLQQLLRNAARLSAVPTLLVGFLLLVAADPILVWSFGAEHSPGANALRLLCLGQIAQVLCGPAGVTLLMTGHQRVPLYATFATLPLFAAAPMAITAGGITAMAALFAIYLGLNHLLQWWATYRLVGIDVHASLTRKALPDRRLMGHPLDDSIRMCNATPVATLQGDRCYATP